MTFWMRAGRKTQTVKLIIQKMIDNEFSPASSKQPGPGNLSYRNLAVQFPET